MPPRAPAPAIHHQRTHDYAHLVRRWRALCRARGLRMAAYTSASGYELYEIETRRPRPDRPWIYISAGIHGDESAATEAPLRWLESTPLAREACNLLIFPCLNPWGLVNNLRTDAEGRDLNRTYHDHSVPQTAAHRARLAERRFDLALTLHEDYDATGLYIYEIKGRPPYWAEDLLATASPHVPIERRRRIEGRSCKNGVVRRALDPAAMPHFPEAFVLHFHHAGRTFTIETPSEAHIDARVAAQVAILERSARLCLDANAVR